MTTSSILSIGLSGLNAAQMGLATTGHNISNVNTENYNRQQVVQGTASPLQTGSGFMGQGTTVETVRRIYSGFLTAQTQQATASATQSDTLSAQLEQLDAMLGDPATGLAPSVSEFFSGVNGVASNPGDIASRQVMISDAQALASRFRQLGDQLGLQQVNANSQITAAVGTINGYGKEIADLNRRIIELAGASGGQPPNDLLDQRDALVSKLNGLVGVSAVVQSNGALNVFLSSGDSLVDGTTSTALAAVPDNNDPRNVQIAMKSPTGASIRLASDAFAGGTIGGLLQFRDGTLTQAQNNLGQIAIALAGQFNDQHALGVDLAGKPGGAFFTVPTPTSQPALSNQGNAALAVTVAPGGASAVVASDYKVTHIGASGTDNYTVTRLSDNQVVSTGAMPPVIDGLAIVASGAAADGDSFLVTATRSAAGQFGVAISDPRAIAAAAPVRTSVPATNAGSGTISAGSVDKSYLTSPPVLSSPPNPALTLTYQSIGNQFTVTPPQPVTVTVNGQPAIAYAAGDPVPYTPGATVTIGGVSVVVGGAPAQGDSFAIVPSSGNPLGDNRNAALLAAMQGAKLVGGAATVGDAYGQLVGLVGGNTSQARVESAAQDALLTQAQTAQQQVSGVNLDEEAANLLRYQQAYQAAAKLMTVAASLFDTILAIGQ